jgi:ABC-type oligopeptide transport system substrate-binding subunit
MHNQKLTLLTTFGAMLLVACGGTSSSTASSTPASSTASSAVSETSSEFVIPSSEALPDLPLANGIFDYTAASFTEKGEILGQLEKFAQDEFIAGIPMYDSAANVLYNSRLTIPSDVFVPNYGFGVSEGTITAPLTAEQEPVEAYRSYFHSWQQTEPATLNIMNDQTSVVSDIASLFKLSYWSTRFNDDKSGYEWFPLLATTERPIPLNANAGGLATQWRVKVRTGAPLVYSTLSEDPALTGFNGRAVALEDYLTPFKLMLDNNFVRATDLASATSGFAGVAEYLAEVAKGEAGNPDFDAVGIKLNEAESAIEFTLNRPLSEFYAMYTLSSNIYSPLPMDFIDAIGGPLEYGKPTEAVDNLLSLGAYTIEEWEPLKQIVFKKNTASIETDRYNFAGYMYTIIPGGSLVAFDEFLAGKLDGVGIPATRLQEFKSDPRRRKTLGATTFKIQVNAADQERWEELFGVNGSVLQTPEADYYEVEPIMSNKDFLNAVYFAIDRDSLADYTGRNPAQWFISEAYMIDPENGVSYRSSEAGQGAYAERLPETNGFSEELARAYFKRAIDTLVEEGTYFPGTADEPTVITLDVHMQTQTSVDIEGALIKDYVESVFNSVDPRFELVLNTFATANWYDVYYNSMLTGQFDMAVGAISGNTLDPLNFMDVLASDQRTGFTLSWGADTSAATQAIRFDGKAWSYNALYEASQSGAVVSNGESATLFSLDGLAQPTTPVDGLYDVTLGGQLLAGVPGVEVTIDAVILWSYVTEDNAAVWFGETLADVLTVNPDGSFLITIEGIDVADGEFTVDVAYTVTVNGNSSEGYQWRDIAYPTGFFPA